MFLSPTTKSKAALTFVFLLSQTRGRTWWISLIHTSLTPQPSLPRLRRRKIDLQLFSILSLQLQVFHILNTTIRFLRQQLTVRIFIIMCKVHVLILMRRHYSYLLFPAAAVDHSGPSNVAHGTFRVLDLPSPRPVPKKFRSNRK